MKEEIALLKTNLSQCENKWNKIVKNTIRENVHLKEENKSLKDRLRRREKESDTTFSNDSQ